MKHYLSLGAGVQSSTLYHKGARGELPILFNAAIFANTQREPEEVYEHLDELEARSKYEKFPIPIYRVTAGDLGADSVELRTSRRTGNRYIRALIPAFVAKSSGGRSLLGRKCTAEYKVRIVQRTARKLAMPPRNCATPVATMHIGISYDEVHRMKPSMQPWVEHRWPLIDAKMTRQDCIEWCLANGYPEPPRSACEFCPFHSDVEWARLKKHQPAAFARAVVFDRTLRENAKQTTGTARLRGEIFLHGSLKPLDQVAFSDADEVDAFGNDCTGLCGT